MNDKTKTIRELFNRGRGLLQAAGLEDAAGEALTLLCAALNWDRAKIFTWADRRPTAGQAELFEQYIARRAARQPAAYLIGHKEFMGLDLLVNSDVLIPRPETELLVELALHKAREMLTVNIEGGLRPAGIKQLLLADVCTGSGAVALALAHLLPQVQISGLDLSEAALKVARMNQELLAERRQLRAEQLCWRQGDLLAPLLAEAEGAAEKFSVITANPPYLTAAEMAELQPETACEPVLALAGGADGLALYQRLAEQAYLLLCPGGWLLSEIGWQQGAKAAAVWREAGFQEVCVQRDYGGRDRVVMGQKKIFRIYFNESE